MIDLSISTYFFSAQNLGKAQWTSPLPQLLTLLSEPRPYPNF